VAVGYTERPARAAIQSTVNIWKGNIVQAEVQSVVVEGILQLRVKVPPAALEPALALADQTAVAVPHMTLVRLDDLGLTVGAAKLPAPPRTIDLKPGLQLVDTGAKRSCFLVATAQMQRELRGYTLRCVEALGLEASAVHPKRVFHVTVSNAGGGDVRASVGSPWEFPWHPL
jgi:hypothetical protein